MQKRYSGGCLCEFIRFNAVDPKEPHTCSCDICRKHTGALTAHWVEFAARDVQWTGAGGEPSTWRSSGTTRRAYCGRCGSTLGAIDDGPTVALLVGAFDNPNEPAFAPQFHSFQDSAPDGGVNR